MITAQGKGIGFFLRSKGLAVRRVSNVEPVRAMAQIRAPLIFIHSLIQALFQVLGIHQKAKCMNVAAFMKVTFS